MAEKGEFERLIASSRQLEKDVSDLQFVVFGPPPARSDGLRTSVDMLRDSMNKAIAWAHELWDVKRREECIGLEECEKLEAKMSKDLAEAIVRLEKGMKANSAGKRMTMLYILGILQFAGLILVALIQKGVVP